MSLANAREQWDDAQAASGTRMLSPGVDTSHGGILYLDAISVSFDGFKALNKLSLGRSTTASCAASSAPTAQARRR